MVFLPIRLQPSEIDILFNSSQMSPGFKVTIDLEGQFIETQDNKEFKFKIDASLKTRLLDGLDDIALTLKYSDAIRKYEMNRAKLVPWLFKKNLKVPFICL